MSGAPDLSLIHDTITALTQVCMVPGCRHERFVHDMTSQPLRRLTQAQAAHIRRLAWVYRDQMPAALRPATDPDRKVAAR